jgi:osmotically-inducible protein OsmY
MVRPTLPLQAALAASLLIGCAGAPKSQEQQAADKQTAVAVREALQADPYLYAEHVTVWADSGVVHLGGRVWSDWAMYEAQRVARSVPGVRETVNEMDLPREELNNSYSRD